MIDVVNGRATMLLAPLTYTLAAEEAERIGVDHVARVSSGEAALNSLGMRLLSLHIEIKLSHRLYLIYVCKFKIKISYKTCIYPSEALMLRNFN